MYLEWDEGDDVNWEDLAKKEHLKPINVLLQKCVREIGKVKSDFKFMRRKEESHRDTSGMVGVFL